MCYQKTIPRQCEETFADFRRGRKNAREGEAGGKEENNANRNNTKFSVGILMEKVAAIPDNNSD